MSLRRSILLVLLVLSTACRTAAPVSSSFPGAQPVDPTLEMLDDIQKRTFLWFWETTNPSNGLVPDRWPSRPFASIAAVGFGLTAYPVGAERGWITREQARDRVLTTLEFFRNAPQGPDAVGMTGYKGFFYHFLDMETGARFQTTELSTIDTTLLIAGALFCQSYFDRDDPKEARIRQVAEELFLAMDWSYFLRRPPLIGMAWRPEPNRLFGAADWRGFNEAPILYILALGSPTHPVGPESWEAWTSTYQWATFYGYEHLNFAPLFGHQYSHIWIDFRGIQDPWLREKGIDLFENSRRATLSQRAYAADNPMGWRGYDENVWGLTACDGPGGGKIEIDGKMRQFHGYWARGAAATEIRDDGTIAPTAAAGSIPFAPEVVIPALAAMKERYGSHLYQKYGFVDAFNPTLTAPVPWEMNRGAIVPGVGWFDDDYLGIDQGPIVLMIENYRSGLIWDVMKKNPHIIRGLRRAGFSGGWLGESE